MLKKQNIVMDATLLTSLQSCPRFADFRFNQLWQPKTGKSNSLECGSLVHAIKEYFNKALINGKTRSDAIDEGFNAGQLYIHGCDICMSEETDCTLHKDEWIGMQNTPAESGKDGKKNLIGYNYVIKTMEEYFDYYRNDSWPVIAAEEVRGKIIYEDDDLRILWKAKFDEIHDTNNGLMSTDTKTMQQRRDSISLNNQFIGQCLIIGARNIRIDKIGFQTSLKAEEKFLRDTISYSADRFAEWAHDIVPYYARMLVAYTQAGHFPPNFTHCENKYGVCQYKEPCETDRGAREEILQLNFIKGKSWDVMND